MTQPADVEVFNAMSGIQDDGSIRPWAWVRVRARTVYGNLYSVNNKPFTRTINGNVVAATPSELDHIIGTAEQISWRYVASDGQPYNFKDFMLLQIEYFIQNMDPAKLAALKQSASILRPFPAGFQADVPGT